MPVTGHKHYKWKGGKTITAKGYVRITAGSDRHKYEHRAVIEKLIGGPIPVGFHVHHQDFDKQHNCSRNLLLLQDVLHNACRRYRPEDIPSWVTEELVEWDEKVQQRVAASSGR